MAHIITVGSFGNSVARYLNMLHHGIEQIEWQWNQPIELATWPLCDVQILASWKPVSRLCRIMDSISFQRGTVFLPLMIDCSWLCFGPIVVPGLGGCWHCWELRMRQHGALNREKDELLRIFDEDENAGPTGYLPSLAMTGAAQIAGILAAIGNREDVAGAIWQMNSFTGEISVGKLHGVDGCKRCGLKRPVEDRTYCEMRRELAFVSSMLRSNSRLP